MRSANVFFVIYDLERLIEIYIDQENRLILQDLTKFIKTVKENFKTKVICDINSYKELNYIMNGVGFYLLKSK